MTYVSSPLVKSTKNHIIQAGLSNIFAWERGARGKWKIFTIFGLKALLKIFDINLLIRLYINKKQVRIKIDDLEDELNQIYDIDNNNNDSNNDDGDAKIDDESDAKMNVDDEEVDQTMAPIILNKLLDKIDNAGGAGQLFHVSSLTICTDLKKLFVWINKVEILRKDDEIYPQGSVCITERIACASRITCKLNVGKKPRSHDIVCPFHI